MFCRSPLNGGRRSKEHVIPAWLLLARGLSGIRLERVRKDANFKTKNVRGAHFVNGIRYGRVCEKCNTGWMSKLEDRAKPILLRLFDQKRLPILTKSERRTLGIWTVKTLAMLNWSSNFRHVILESELQEMNGGSQMPAHFSAYLAVNPQWQNIDWFETVNWTTIASSELGILGMNGWKIALQIGRLVVIAVKPPDTRLLVAHAKNVHTPLILASAPRICPVRPITKEPKTSKGHLWLILESLQAVHAQYDGQDPVAELSIQI